MARIRETLSLTLDPELVEKIRAKAEAENRTVSNLVETILRKAIEG